jgi:cell division protein FtsW
VKSFFKGFIPVSLVLAVVCGLILIQPDLGTVLLIGMVAFLMFFCGGIRFFYLAGSFICFLPLLYEFIFKVDYRRKRILSFLNPWEDPQGISFQIVQSFIALGSGGLWGVGLGQSKQKLFYLPEAHTDFIFSIIGEELGFVGCGVIIILFLVLFTLGFKISFKANNLKAHLFALGITTMIFLQAVINMGVVSGALPTKGLPLPFISFGGTNLVMLMLGVGILLNISKFEEEVVVDFVRKKRKSKKVSNLLSKVAALAK